MWWNDKDCTPRWNCSFQDSLLWVWPICSGPNTVYLGFIRHLICTMAYGSIYCANHNCSRWQFFRENKSIFDMKHLSSRQFTWNVIEKKSFLECRLQQILFCTLRVKVPINPGPAEPANYPACANSVDPEKPTDLDLHLDLDLVFLSFSMWLCINSFDQANWLADC